MRVVLERNLNFERKELVSRMRLMQSRPDIQKILGMKLNQLPDRLAEYLKKLNLLDIDGSLTTLGEKALKEGQVSIDEYGQYEIWYLLDDPWFGTCPVALHRLRAGKNSDNKDQKDNKWNAPGEYDTIWDVRGENEMFPVLDSDTGSRTLIDSISAKAIRKIPVRKATGTLRCETENVDEYSIPCEISGILQWSNKDRSSENLNILRSYSKNVKSLLSDVLGPEYDRDRNVLICNSAPEDPQELTSFVRAHYERENVKSNNYVNFSKISIFEAPLRASNPAVAREWLTKLMQHSWATRYISREQAELEQQAWLQSPALSNMGISPLSGEELIRVLGRQSGRAHWNIAAMHDLIPSGIKVKMPFTLSKDECSVDQIIHRHLFDRREVQKVIISDPYVRPESLAVLKRILPEKIPVEIYSFKYKLQGHLPKNWVQINLPKGDTHDRIWLIQSKNMWENWNFSTSADHFDEKDGVIFMNKQMTITPIEKLPQYLQNIIGVQNDGGLL